MSLLLLLRRVFRSLGRRGRSKAEIDEELQFHLEMRERDNLLAGMPPDEARRAAHRRFGSFQNVREDCREIHGASLGEATWRDVRFGLRLLRKNPGFTAVAVLTLALGIGSNSAIFSVVQAVILKPLAFPDPATLVSVKCANTRLDGAPVRISMPELTAFGDRAGVFAELSYVWPMHGNLTGVDKPQRLEALAVSASYFRLLGREPALGRVFGAEEADSPGWAEGAVLSHRAWQRYFGGDPSVLGRKIGLDYDPYRIIGVMPPDFRHPGPTLQGHTDVWITSGQADAATNRRARRFPSLVARLRSGVSADEAHARLEAIAALLRRDFPDDYPPAAGWSVHVRPLLDDLVGGSRALLLTMMGAVAFVLLICCASLANLLLARAAARRREFAIRRALGTSPAALVRQVLVESLLLSLLGGAAGLLLAAWLRPLIVALAPGGLPRVDEAGVGGVSVLVFTFGVAMATSVLFGLAPAMSLGNVDVHSALKDGASGAGIGRHAQRTRAWLVGGQIAVSLTLLAGAALLLRSFWNVLQVDAGFEPSRVLIGNVWLPPPSRPEIEAPYRTPQKRSAFVREVLHRLRAAPGVESAAMGAGQSIPLVGLNAVSVAASGHDTGTLFSAQAAAVSPGFFPTMGIRVLSGRDFLETDESGQRVALIDETMAKCFWAGADPIGRRFRTEAAVGPGWLVRPAAAGAIEWITVIGVVNRVKSRSFEVADAPHVYFPIYQRSHYGATIFVRTQGDPAALRQTLEGAVQAVDGDLPVFGVQTMDEVVSTSLAERRFTLVLLGTFALVALVLSGLGLYGVTAQAVEQRRREIGIRIALGAAPRDVARRVATQYLVIAAYGIAAGTVGAVVLTQFLQGLLFEATTTDPVAYAGALLLLATVALLASYPPSRQAARADPTVVLRSE